MRRSPTTENSRNVASTLSYHCFIREHPSSRTPGIYHVSSKRKHFTRERKRIGDGFVSYMKSLKIICILKNLFCFSGLSFFHRWKKIGSVGSQLGMICVWSYGRTLSPPTLPLLLQSLPLYPHLLPPVPHYFIVPPSPSASLVCQVFHRCGAVVVTWQSSPLQSMAQHFLIYCHHIPSILILPSP